MLLVRAAHDVAVQHFAAFLTYDAIAEIVSLALRTAIPAHRHPSRVDSPPFFALMANHGGQNAQRDLRQLIDADAMHDEIEHHIYPGANFGHAFRLCQVDARRLPTKLKSSCPNQITFSTSPATVQSCHVAKRSLSTAR